MNVTTGKKPKVPRAVIYGPEGIGKSTLASQFPNPLFIDTEGSTDRLDVARTDKPTSWVMIKKLLAEFKADSMGFQTLVIDTVDWAERMAIADICAQKGIESLGGSNDYGKSYNLLYQEWGRFLDFLTEIRDSQNVAIVLLAHSQMRKFEEPNESGAYDRWELKLEKKTSAVTKEWADMLLFVNYKTIVVDVDGTKKAQGGKRVMYTSHHPCWDAKNRDGFADELPLKFESIGECIPKQTKKEEWKHAETQLTTEPKENTPEEEVPSALFDLMTMHGVSCADIRKAVAKRGYYPEHTPIAKYDQEFVNGVLVGAWDKVYAAIQEMKEGN